MTRPTALPIRRDYILAGRCGNPDERVRVTAKNWMPAYGTSSPDTDGEWWYAFRAEGDRTATLMCTANSLRPA